MPEEQPSSTGSGLDPKVSALLAYLLGLVGGIVFYVTSKDSFVRFHAMQSIIASIAVAILYVGLTIMWFLIPFIMIFSWLLYFAIFVVWVVLMMKAYQGERFKLPIIGDMAEKYAR